MNHKYQQNSLIFRIFREDELGRLNKRIEQIKTSRGPFDTHTLASSLPKLPNKIPLVEQKLKIKKENEQLVGRIVQATEGHNSPIHKIFHNCSFNQSERRLPKDYFFRLEEQRRIDIENERLDKAISARRRRKML